MLNNIVRLIFLLILPVISKKTNKPVTVVTVTAGTTAILPCTAEDAEHLMVIWMNPKKILISQKESRFIDDTRMSIERPFLGDWNLHIRHVEYKDRGVYTCTINSLPVVVRHINLTVQVPSMIIDRLSTSDVRVREGENVKLVCNATGIPQPNITWYRQTIKTVLQKERVGTDGEVLVIHNISRYCGGIYACQAYNNVPPAVTRLIKVEVQFEPEVKLRNNRLGQKRHKETILECIITASPQGVNVWKRGSREISGEDQWNYRLEVFPESPFTVYLTLRIINVQASDFGEYTCEASNTLGKRRAKMELYEFFDPYTTTTTSITTTTQTTILPKTTTLINYDQVDKNEDSLFVSDGQIVDNNRKYGRKDTVTKSSSLYKEQEKIKTGYIGTGSVSLNRAHIEKSASNISLTVMFVVVWTLIYHQT